MADKPLPGVLRAVAELAAARDHSKREAEPELVKAMMLARSHGYTYQDLADVVGTSRQACHEMVTRRHHQS